MFTGIVEEVGTVRSVGPGRLVINAKRVTWGTNLGDSIAVNGCDLTAVDIDEDGFTSNVIDETYRRTNLGDLKPGDPVNLERAMQLAGRVGGHLVRGVIEYTGTLESFTPEEHSIVARFKARTAESAARIKAAKQAVGPVASFAGTGEPDANTGALAREYQNLTR